MATNVLTVGRTFMISLIAGVTTGMGNGSVFGAAMMCALGRGRFENWGGIYGAAYNPMTFDGFVNWCMLLFGFAFTVVMLIMLHKHGELEAAATAGQVGGHKSSHA